MVSLFLLGVVVLFAIVFWQVIRDKNRKIRRSMTELKSATNKLVEKEKMASLGILSAGVAHEINNPMNYIKGGISIISTHLKKNSDAIPSEIQESVQRVNEGINRVTSMVKSLNHFSRSDDEIKKKVDIQLILENCLVMLNHQVTKKIDVQKNYAAYEHNVFGNDGQLHQVFLNILSNAIQSIQNEGKITIKTQIENGKLQIIIADDGQGIPNELQEKVTEPFFTTKEPGEGTGLGLYICYNILRKHDSQLQITSKESVGTQVLVAFDLI
ncbi:MAG: signal transduction histidine kinase [Cyclobacteriaceae bacterium]